MELELDTKGNPQYLRAAVHGADSRGLHNWALLEALIGRGYYRLRGASVEMFLQLKDGRVKARIEVTDVTKDEYDQLVLEAERRLRADLDELYALREKMRVLKQAFPRDWEVPA